MRRSQLRFVFAGLLAALVAAVRVGVVTVAAQNKPQPGVGVAQPVLPGQPGKKDKKDDKKDDRPPEDDNNAFAFPYERDAKAQLQGAREYLQYKSPPWNTVCPLLQNILEAKTDSFFNTYFVAGGQ